MQLTLTLEAEHGATTEVLLDADPATPLRIVEQVLAPHLPAPGRLLLAGAPLDADLALGDSGLRDGVRLGVGTPLPCPPAARPGTPQLHVVGGPDAGCVLPLSDGRTVLGRGAVADLRLDDKSCPGGTSLCPAGTRAASRISALPTAPGSTGRRSRRACRRR